MRCMNLTELQQRLDALNINNELYSIDTIEKPNAYHISSYNGLYDVYFCDERGNRVYFGTNLECSKACDLILSKIQGELDSAKELDKINQQNFLLYKKKIENNSTPRVFAVSGDGIAIEKAKDESIVYSENQTAILDARGVTGTCLVPYGVERILSESFGPNIVNIILPVSVIQIESRAFLSCINLRQILLPTSVISLGANIFDNCFSLEKIWVCEERLTDYISDPYFKIYRDFFVPYKKVEYEMIAKLIANSRLVNRTS